MVDSSNATALASYAGGNQRVDNLCSSSQYNCHGGASGLADHPAIPAGTSTQQVYLNDGTSAGDFDMATFLSTSLGRHNWWNVKGIRVEVTAAASRGGQTHFVTLAEFVIPRNIEVNKIR
jgi:hypothetical protein